jgi:hypothetical protein
VLTTALDFNEELAVGMYGNASYHAVADLGAICEQGGCLVLDGPVTACYGEPTGGLAVRLASPWESLQLRYRVWATTYSVSPLAIGYSSGCTGSLSVALSPLAQPDGVYTYASEWTTASIAPCGAPEDENGFTVSLDCSEYQQPPPVKVQRRSSRVNTSRRSAAGTCLSRRRGFAPGRRFFADLALLTPPLAPSCGSRP